MLACIEGKKYLILDGYQHLAIQNAVLSEHPFLKGTNDLHAYSYHPSLECFCIRRIFIRRLPFFVENAAVAHCTGARKSKRVFYDSCTKGCALCTFCSGRKRALSLSAQFRTHYQQGTHQRANRYAHESVSRTLARASRLQPKNIQNRSLGLQISQITFFPSTKRHCSITVYMV